jgi:hypothetical protein
MFAILLLPVIEHGTGAAPNEHVCRGDFTVFPRADMRVCAPVLLTQSGNAIHEPSLTIAHCDLTMISCPTNTKQEVPRRSRMLDWTS